MKKFLLVLALTGCVFGTTANTTLAATTVSDTSESTVAEAGAPEVTDEIEERTDAILQVVEEAVNRDMIESAAEQFDYQYAEGIGDEFAAACQVWKDAAEDIGSYKGIVADSMTTSGTADEYTLSFEIEGSNHNADVEMYYTSETMLFPEMQISAQITFGDLFEDSTFVVSAVVIAILLIVIIVLAVKLASAKNAAADGQSGKKAVDQTIAQIMQKEELSDNLELVAVIAAAIAASQGASDTSGFVVRSIKRAHTNNWRNA